MKPWYYRRKGSDDCLGDTICWDCLEQLQETEENVARLNLSYTAPRQSEQYEPAPDVRWPGCNCEVPDPG